MSIAGLGATAASAANTGPAYDWSGIYVGIHAGAAKGRITATDVTQPSGGFFTDLVPAGTEGFKFRKAGLAGGVHVGAQYQWGQFVLGAEGAWTITHIRQTIVSPYFPDTDTERAKLPRYITLVGRAGYAFDRFMIYGKGGYASGKVNFRARDNDSLVTYTKNDRQHGYALGGGIDYALTQHLLFGGDYTHVKLGSKTSSGDNIFDDGTLGSNPETYRTRATVDAVVARLTFKFGGRGQAPELAPPPPPPPSTQTCADGSVIVGADTCPAPPPPPSPPTPPAPEPAGERG